MIKADFQSIQSQVAGFLCNSSDNAVALVLMPVHVYRKGTMWIHETNVMKRLSQSNLNIDRTWHLMFDKKQA
jgi:hypothetical protein